MPSNKEIKVVLKLKDELSKRLKGMRGHFHRFSKAVRDNWMGVTAAIAGTIFIFKKLSDFARRAFSEMVIKVSSQIEQLKIRLKVLLGSVQEGNKVFKDMSELAGEVPKTYDEIMESATSLAAVVEGGSEEVKKFMPIIVDLSAATGISVMDVTSQMIRMYSAGAASADMFRERGVLAMLGFKAGVSYTAKETMKQVVASWESATSKFRGASEELAKSFEGLMSMMQDAWFQFRSVVGEKAFESVKLDLQAILKLIDQMKESGQYEELAINIGNIFESLYTGMKGSIGLIIDSLITMRKILINTEQGWTMFWLNSLKLQGSTNEEYLKSLQDRINELDREYRQIYKIEEAWKTVQDSIIKIKEELKNMSPEIPKNLRDPFMAPETIRVRKNVLKESLKEFAKFAKVQEEVARGLYRNMAAAFKTFFLDAFKGQLKTAKDYFRAFGESLLDIVADIAGRIIAYFAIIKPLTAMFPSLGPVFGLPTKHTGGKIEKYHQGSVIRAHSGLALRHDEVPFVGLEGEGVLNRRAMAAIGDDNFRRLNTGEGIGGGTTINYFIYAADSKSFVQMLQENEASIHMIVQQAQRFNIPGFRGRE